MGCSFNNMSYRINIIFFILAVIGAVAAAHNALNFRYQRDRASYMLTHYGTQAIVPPIINFHIVDRGSFIEIQSSSSVEYTLKTTVNNAFPPLDLDKTFTISKENFVIPETVTVSAPWVRRCYYWNL